MAYMGTIVSKGKAQGVVVATGMQTQVGKIADRVNKGRADSKTILQKRFVTQLDFSREFALTCFRIYQS